MIMLMFKSIHGLVPNYLCYEITMQRHIAVRTAIGITIQSTGTLAESSYLIVFDSPLLFNFTSGTQSLQTHFI